MLQGERNRQRIRAKTADSACTTRVARLAFCFASLCHSSGDGCSLYKPASYCRQYAAGRFDDAVTGFSTFPFFPQLWRTAFLHPPETLGGKGASVCVRATGARKHLQEQAQHKGSRSGKSSCGRWEFSSCASIVFDSELLLLV